MTKISLLKLQSCKKRLDNENRSQYHALMEKCHCARVPFDQIVRLAVHNQCSYERVAKELNAGETCTACREDMKAYCESAGAGTCAEHSRSTSTQLQLQAAL